MPDVPPKHQLRGIRRNGWWLVFHPGFRTPLLALQEEVAGIERRAEAGWETGSKPKLLKRILDLILKEIPANPGARTFEQGNTLGADARGWRRAKFLGRFRLFFRFDSGSKVIVYAWVNDENTLCKSGSATDPYSVFRGMLLGEDPPTNWKKLLDACRTQEELRADQELGLRLGPRELGFADSRVETLPEPPKEDPMPLKKRERGRGKR